jgi:hypothetical protein
MIRPMSEFGPFAPPLVACCGTRRRPAAFAAAASLASALALHLTPRRERRAAATSQETRRPLSGRSSSRLFPPSRGLAPQRVCDYSAFAAGPTKETGARKPRPPGILATRKGTRRESSFRHPALA